MFMSSFLFVMMSFLACNNDDDNNGIGNNVDVIVGSWKISSIVVDDTDIYPILALQGICELDNVTHFHNDYSLVIKTFEENSDGNCVSGSDDNGTWSKEGNVYTITMGSTPSTVTPEFSNNNNRFSVNQDFEGQMARVTFSRQ